jgi:hypothetical protein
VTLLVSRISSRRAAVQVSCISDKRLNRPHGPETLVQTGFGEITGQVLQPDCEGQAFCPLLESGGGDSPTQASAREHSSNTKANDPRRESPWRGGVGLFRQPVARSGGAVHRPAALPRRTPFAAAESLVAPVSPSLTKDAFAIGDSNRNTN